MVGSSGVYDPTTEFGPSAELNPPRPDHRDLSADEWGVIGEGPPAAWEAFVDQLNGGNFDGTPVKLRPEASPWPETEMAFARDAQKERGQALVATVDMATESMAYLQGVIGARANGTTAEKFMGEADSRVDDYAERFRDGDRPEQFVVELDTDGDLQNFQEGRHRALAARQAGVDWVPVVVVRNTGGTFHRSDLMRSDDGPGYRKHYEVDE